MFETPLIERFSRIHPAAPFVFWLPVLGYTAYRSLGVGVAAFAGLLLIGHWLRERDALEPATSGAIAQPIFRLAQ